MAGDLKEKASKLVDEASEKLDEMGVGEKVSGFVDAAKEKLEDATEWVEEKAIEKQKDLKSKERKKQLIIEISQIQPHVENQLQK